MIWHGSDSIKARWRTASRRKYRWFHSVRYRETGGKKEVSPVNTTAGTIGPMATPTHISLQGHTADGESR